MNTEYAKAQLEEATIAAQSALIRRDNAKKYSKAWREACDDYEFWTNKKANMAAMVAA